MADSTLDSELFVLYDKWPGPARLLDLATIPTGGMAGSTHHNVASAKYQPGEKIALFNQKVGTHAIEGYSIFVYLQVGTQNADELIAAKSIVVCDSATDPHVVTNDPDSCIVSTGSGLYAIAISAMTDGRYGWFWCGGVCPEYFLADLGGDYDTEGNVVAGAITVHDLVADKMGFGPVATVEQACGFAIAADA